MNFQWVLRWTAHYNPDKGAQLGWNLHAYPETAYRSCVGILDLAKKKGEDRLINTCRRGLHYQSFGYRIIDNIIKKGLDNEPWEEVLMDF